jgi:hypothetical protein
VVIDDPGSDRVRWNQPAAGRLDRRGSRSPVDPTPAVGPDHVVPVTGGAPALFMLEEKDGRNRTHVRIVALTDPLGHITLTDHRAEWPSHGWTSDETWTCDSRFRSTHGWTTPGGQRAHLDRARVDSRRGRRGG